MNRTAANNIVNLFTSILFLTLPACATFSSHGITEVPKINVANVKSLPLRNIPANTLSLTIMDNRDNSLRENTAELQKELQRALTAILKSQGLTVAKENPTNLLFSVQDQQVGDDKEGCVKMNAMLAIPKVANLYSDAVSCVETKSPVSTVTMGSNISQAYEMGLTTVFKSLSGNLQKLTPVKK